VTLPNPEPSKQGPKVEDPEVPDRTIEGPTRIEEPEVPGPEIEPPYDPEVE
jgi:hypothetical protein